MSRRGHTLIELLLVLALAALLAGVAVPRVAGVLDGLAVEDAAQRIVALHQRARLAAVLDNVVARYRIAPETLAVAVVVGGDTVSRGGASGPAADGITLTGPDHPIVWAPTGLALGASNGTWQLRRGAAQRQVVVSRLGRARIVR